MRKEAWEVNFRCEEKAVDLSKLGSLRKEASQENGQGGKSLFFITIGFLCLFASRSRFARVFSTANRLHSDFQYVEGSAFS
jgi:hypothetical protein